MPEAKEDIVNSIESLLESAADYGKTSFDLVKLKAIDKMSDVVSTIIPNAIVFLIFITFLLFINLGLSFYLGKILGDIFYGFLVVALFYGIVGLLVHFLMYNRIKNKISNFIIKQALK